MKVHGATTISFETFLGVVYSELIDQAQSSDLSKSFALFDSDQNGEIDLKEFEVRVPFVLACLVSTRQDVSLFTIISAVDRRDSWRWGI